MLMWQQCGPVMNEGMGTLVKAVLLEGDEA